MEQQRRSSDYGDEIMPTLHLPSLQMLMPRERRNFMKIYNAACRSFRARRRGNGGNSTRYTEQANDDATEEAVDPAEALAILEHYYGEGDDDDENNGDNDNDGDNEDDDDNENDDDENDNNDNNNDKKKTAAVRRRR